MMMGQWVWRELYRSGGLKAILRFLIGFRFICILHDQLACQRVIQDQ